MKKIEDELKGGDSLSNLNQEFSIFLNVLSSWGGKKAWTMVMLISHPDGEYIFL